MAAPATFFVIGMTRYVGPSEVTMLLAFFLFFVAKIMSRDTTVKSRLFMFKIIDYIMCVFEYPATLTSYRKRKRNISLVFSGGTTAQDRLD